MSGDVQFEGTPEEWDALVQRNKQNMTQQTAVEWFWRWWMDNPFASFEEAVYSYKQAKAMERDQIILAHNYGEYFSQFRDSLDDEHGKQYYNETYGK